MKRARQAKIRQNLIIVSALFGLLLSTASVGAAETICSFDGPDYAWHPSGVGIELRDFIVTALHDPPQDGDTLTVRFRLRSTGQAPLVLDAKKGVFTAADTPTGSQEFGHDVRSGSLGMGAEIAYETTFGVTSGDWSVWPAYRGSAGEAPPSPWHACSFSVSEETSAADTIAPRVAIIMDPPAPTSSERVTYTATAADESGIANVQIIVDNITIQSCRSRTCISYGGPYPAGTNHTYKATAMDVMGNSNSTKEYTFMIPFSAGDSDGDGVPDARDRCPATPAGMRVFEDGCPCRDTDGGSNPNVAGQLLRPGRAPSAGGLIPGLPSPGGAGSPGGAPAVIDEVLQEDRCIGNHSVYEGVCGPEGEPSGISYLCVAGCQDRACACSETDGGYNIYTRGEARWGAFGGYPPDAVRTDECRSARTLIEYTCSRGERRRDEVPCSTRCVDGACIRPEPLTIRLLPPGRTINHGESFVLQFYITNPMPDATVASVDVLWEDGTSRHRFDALPTLSGQPRSMFTTPGRGAVSITFASPGLHVITVNATNNYGISATGTARVTVREKTRCTATSAKYYPTDTPCQGDWFTGPGRASINYNTRVKACSGVEVCSERLDYLARDAEVCCNGQDLFSGYPAQTRFTYSKRRVCDRALGEVAGIADSALLTEEKLKLCKAKYLVYGVGSGNVYLKDYFSAETCCASVFCANESFHGRALPWPMSNIAVDSLWCRASDTGYWRDDTDMSRNNIHISEVPAHSSINVLNTGSCVDYSMAVTTALRKAGFLRHEVMNVGATGHVYNMVWLPGATEYQFVDTVGNTGGDFFSGEGWKWRVRGRNYTHCSFRRDKCSTDAGMGRCPSREQVAGC